MKFVLLFLFSVSAFGSTGKDCAQLLTHYDQSLRNHLLSKFSQGFDQRHQDYHTRMRPIVETPIATPIKTKDAHVIYMGSGSDVLRPLIEFPSAQHFHLYDLIDHSGYSFKFDTVSESVKSIQIVADPGSFRWVDNGFLDHVHHWVMFTAPSFFGPLENYFRDRIPKSSGLRRPAVFQADFLGKTKRFYIQPVDFENIEVVSKVLRKIPDRKLKGLIWGPGTCLTTCVPVWKRLVNKLKRSSGSLLSEAADIEEKGYFSITFEDTDRFHTRYELPIEKMAQLLGAKTTKIVDTKDVYVFPNETLVEPIKKVLFSNFDEVRAIDWK